MSLCGSYTLSLHKYTVCVLAALDELGKRVPQLGQLEDLPVQELQQGAQMGAEGLPLLLGVLHRLLQGTQPRLQVLVPLLRGLRGEGHAPGGRGERRSR